MLAGVAEHRPVDRVGEMALQDAHGFATGVAVGAGVVVECAGAGSDHARTVDRRHGGPDFMDAATFAPAADGGLGRVALGAGWRS